MEDNCKMENSDPPEKSDLKIDSYRWVIVAIFAGYFGTNFFLFMQFTIIANITEKFYDVNSFYADATGLVFMGSYILLFIPVGHLIQKKNLRQTALISTGLTAFGNFIKLFAASPDKFYLILLSQSICGLAQVFMISMPAQLASTWFGGGEVSLACAIGVMGSQLGLALGCMIPSLLVPDSANTQEIGDGFFALFTLDNVSSITMFILVILFFRACPDSPPSHAQANRPSIDDEISYLAAFKVLLKNVEYKLVLLTFGLAWGVFNCLGIIINELYLHYFPGRSKELGFLTLCAVIAGGVFGTIFFGYILDRTHAFKRVTSTVIILNCFTWIGVIIAFEARSSVVTSLLIPLNGFFCGSLVVMGYEFATEMTYPIPEVFSASLLNAVVYLFAILDVIVIEIAFQTVGFLAGQLIFLGIMVAAAIVSFFIPTDYKRADANLLKSILTTNYGSGLDDKIP